MGLWRHMTPPHAQQLKDGLLPAHHLPPPATWVAQRRHNGTMVPCSSTGPRMAPMAKVTSTAYAQTRVFATTRLASATACLVMKDLHASAMCAQMTAMVTAHAKASPTWQPHTAPHTICGIPPATLHGQPRGHATLSRTETTQTRFVLRRSVLAVVSVTRPLVCASALRDTLGMIAVCRMPLPLK